MLNNRQVCSSSAWKLLIHVCSSNGLPFRQAALRAQAPWSPDTAPGSARKRRAATASGSGPALGPYTAPPAPRPPAARPRGSGADGRPAASPRRRVRRALPFSVPASPAACVSPAQGHGAGFGGPETCTRAAPALSGQSGALGRAGCAAEDCIAGAAKPGDLSGDPALTLPRSPGRTEPQSCTQGTLLSASCAPAADPSQDLPQALPIDLLCAERLSGGSGDGAVCAVAAGARSGRCIESVTSGVGPSGSQGRSGLEESSSAHGTPRARNRTGRPRSGGVRQILSLVPRLGAGCVCECLHTISFPGQLQHHTHRFCLMTYSCLQPGWHWQAQHFRMRGM